MKRAKQTITYYKNFDLFRKIVQNANENGVPFEVHHGTYTTAVYFPETGSRFQFITDKHDERVFAANRMIVRDLSQVPGVLHGIVSQKWPTDNYDSARGLTPFKSDSVYNVDISSCYATTLLNSGLISFETYNFLQRLPKSARLPAIGMLAKNKIIYYYDKGELTDFQPEQSELSQVFYYVVHKANNVMQECSFWLQEHFIFYWVDGIFFKKDAPAFCVESCVEILDSHNYRYKWENVRDFSVWRQDDKLFVDMVKNGEHKFQVFADKNFSRNFNEALGGWVAGQKAAKALPFE